MMPAMHGGPFPGLHAGREPHDDPQATRRDRVNGDGPVREAPVQIDGRRHDRHLGDNEPDEDAEQHVHVGNVVGVPAGFANREVMPT
jgi:hypothetical protein